MCLINGLLMYHNYYDLTVFHLSFFPYVLCLLHQPWTRSFMIPKIYIKEVIYSRVRKDKVSSVSRLKIKLLLNPNEWEFYLDFLGRRWTLRASYENWSSPSDLCTKWCCATCLHPCLFILLVSFTIDEIIGNYELTLTSLNFQFKLSRRSWGKLMTDIESYLFVG